MTVGLPLVAFVLEAAASFFEAPAGAFFGLALVGAAAFFLGGGLSVPVSLWERRVATMVMINQRSFRNNTVAGEVEKHNEYRTSNLLR
jgi:hypothetical protein